MSLLLAFLLIRGFHLPGYLYIIALIVYVIDVTIKLLQNKRFP